MNKKQKNSCFYGNGNNPKTHNCCKGKKMKEL